MKIKQNCKRTNCFNIIYSQHALLAYGNFFDHEITVLEFFGVSGNFWEAANIFDIELSESTKIEFGRNPCNFSTIFLWTTKFTINSYKQ